MRVFDANGGERRHQRVSIEMRMPAGSGQASNVDEPLDAVCAQQLGEFVQRAG
jgi:hypothetical protein